MVDQPAAIQEPVPTPWVRTPAQQSEFDKYVLKI